MKEVIMKVPSFSADYPKAPIYVADLVRCKECKYAEVADTTDDQDGYICQFHRGSIWFSGSFCSWGEAKESE